MFELNRTNQNDYHYGLYQEQLYQIKKNSLLYSNNPELVIKYFSINLALSNNIDQVDVLFPQNVPSKSADIGDESVNEAGYQASNSSTIHGTGMFDKFKNFTYDIFEFTPILEMTPFTYTPNSDNNEGTSGSLSLMTIDKPKVGDLFMYYNKKSEQDNNLVDQTEIFQITSVQMQRTSNDILPIYQLEFKTANILRSTLKKFSINEIFFYDNLQNNFTSSECWVPYQIISKDFKKLKSLDKNYNRDRARYELNTLELNKQNKPELVKKIPLVFNNLIKRIQNSSYNQARFKIVKNISTNLSIADFLNIDTNTQWKTLFLKLKDDSDVQDAQDTQDVQDTQDTQDTQNDTNTYGALDNEINSNSNINNDDENIDNVNNISDGTNGTSDTTGTSQSNTNTNTNTDDTNNIDINNNDSNVLNNLKKIFISNNESTGNSTFLIKNILYLYLFYYFICNGTIYDKIKNYIDPKDLENFLDPETDEETFQKIFDKYQTENIIGFVDKDLKSDTFIIIDNLEFLMNLPKFDTDHYIEDKKPLNKVQVVIQNNFNIYYILYNYLENIYKVAFCKKKYIKFPEDLEKEKNMFTNSEKIKNVKYYNLFNCPNKSNTNTNQITDYTNYIDGSFCWDDSGLIINYSKKIILPIGDLGLPIALSYQYGIQYRDDYNIEKDNA